MDVLTPEQRSFCMSQIRGKDTKPETMLRKALWSLGFRHRKMSDLAGKPDIVYPYLKTVIFVDGCFWHKCPEHYRPPKTRADFWEKKISENVERDTKNNTLLQAQGWLVLRVWEHDIKQSLPECVGYIESILLDRKLNVKNTILQLNIIKPMADCSC